MNPHYAQVALRAGHRCEYCHAPEVVFNFPFEVEHIIPVAHAGTDTEMNWALACRSCNLWKSAHLSGRDPESGVEVRLFHPRDDLWETHFALASHRWNDAVVEVIALRQQFAYGWQLTGTIAQDPSATSNQTRISGVTMAQWCLTPDDPPTNGTDTINSVT